MDAMIGDFQSLHQVAMTSCRQRVERALTEAGISEDIITSAMVHMTEDVHEHLLCASNSASTAGILSKTLWARGKYCNLGSMMY